MLYRSLVVAEGNGCFECGEVIELRVRLVTIQNLSDPKKIAVSF